QTATPLDLLRRRFCFIAPSGITILEVTQPMSTTFMESPSMLFTSESVTEGHPDKMCDQISDAVLDALLAQDPMARVACETAVKTGFVMLLGEITTSAFVDFDKLVRQV